jgi:hypothetical protein
VVAVEALLRVMAESDSRIAEGYAMAQTLVVEGLNAAEFKLIDRPQSLGTGEFPVLDANSYAISARAS